MGLKIYGLYVHTYIDRPEAFDPRLPEAVAMLKGTPTTLWITVQKPKTASADDEAKAVAVVQRVADLAKAHGVQVALYGHAGFYVEHALDSARVVGKAKRAESRRHHQPVSRVHERRRRQASTPTVSAVAPQATRVSINGVDVAAKNYITRLDQGDFDIVALPAQAAAAGYSGPIGLQAYNVPGDPRQNLAANIATWRRIASQLDEGAAGAPAQNVLTAKEKADGWKLLFDGRTTERVEGIRQAGLSHRGLGGRGRAR